MKLNNNKGFAITGILYGLLILFALLVGTYLTILTAKKNRLDGIITSIEEEYNEKEYIITYDANGGDGAPSSQKKLQGVDLTLSNTIPNKMGYKFVNWNTNQDGSGVSYIAGSNYTANKSTTLYATWEFVGYVVTLYVDAQFNSNIVVSSGGTYTKSFASMTSTAFVECTNGQIASVWVNTSFTGTITIDKVTANTRCDVMW